MKEALVITNSNHVRDPRPLRMIEALKKQMHVTVLSKAPGNKDPDVEFMRLPEKNILLKINIIFHLLTHNYKPIIWNSKFKELADLILTKNFNLIVTHDISLLPLALKIKKNGKVLLDAREYYPRLFEDRFVWRLFWRGYNNYLVSTYLNHVDKMVTVSDGIANEYYKEYGVKSDVVMSLPPYNTNTPSRIDPKKITIIHHGSAVPSRRIEIMIEMMNYLDDRFTLDLMLVPTIPSYLKNLYKMINKRSTIKIIPPVPFQEIIPFTNQYDIGLYLAPPTSFNLKYALPNKFFEFIQARLAVAIGPSPEMTRIVRKWDCGIVANSFEPKVLAGELNKLTADKIMYYKLQSHRASAELNHDANDKKIRSIVHELIG